MLLGSFVGLGILSAACADSGGSPADPCAGVSCSGQGTCEASGGAAQCRCNEGYTAEGLNCVARLPDDLDNPDDPGENIESETIDPCAEIDCSGHGTCEAVENTAQCRCDPGYLPQGSSCIPDGDADPEEEAPTPCLNSRECRSVDACDPRLRICVPAVGVLRGWVETSLPDPDRPNPGGNGPGEMLGGWRGEGLYVGPGVETKFETKDGTQWLVMTLKHILSATISRRIDLRVAVSAIGVAGQAVELTEANFSGMVYRLVAASAADNAPTTTTPEIAIVGGFVIADVADIRPGGRLNARFDLELRPPPPTSP